MSLTRTPRSELPRRVVRLLLDRGLLGTADVHRYGVTARDVSESNGVVLVEVGNGNGFAAKDLRVPREGGQGEPERELALLHAAAELPDASDLLAPMVLHEPDEALLVLDGLVAARRLDRVPDPLASGPARLLGRTLGRWHRAAADLTLEPARPWIHDVDGAAAPPVLRTDPTLSALVREFRAGPEAAVLDRARELWAPDTTIHGDVRFANVLVRPSPPSAHLVDWESAGRGDSTWDVAGAVQEYVTAGRPFPPADPGDPVRALLDAYTDARGAGPDPERLAASLGARLLHRALQLSTWLADPRAEVARHRELAVAVSGGAVEVR
ncbi:MAG: phosphotransferase [Actinomycetota bacterium]|nr:phosphotransferase [Actinomycetota bacterium]